MNRLLFVGLLFVSVFYASAQRYSYLNYSIDKGLPQSQISSLIQDEKGYLWIGTMGGLSRFNGQTFTNFSTKNNLFSNRITSLNFENDSLLIGHEGGISIYNKRKFHHFTFEENFKNIPVTVIKIFKEKLFVFTNGVGYYKYEKGNFKHIFFHNSDQNRIRSAIVHKGILYLATRDGILASKDGKQFDILPKTEKLNISGLISYDSVQLFFTTFNSQAGFYHLNTQKIEELPLKEDYFGMRNCYKTQSGEIWIPYLEGLLRIDKVLGVQKINKENGLEYDNINVVYEDNNNSIWLGSEGKGIFKFAGSHIQLLSLPEKYNIISPMTACVATNSFDLVGTYDGKLILLGKNGQKDHLFEIKNTPIWTILEIDNGQALVGTGEGLFLFDTRKLRIKKISVFKQEDSRRKVTHISKYDDNYYVSGDFGLIILDQKLLPIQQFQSELTGTIRSIAITDKGVMIGSDNGLFIIRNNKIVRYLNFKHKINCLLEGINHSIWIGTEEGVFLLRDQSIQPIFLSTRVSSNLINFINKSKNYLIIGTNDGIYYTSSIDLKLKFKHIGLEEGISNLETNINSSYMTQKGILYFGTATGIDMLNINNYENHELSEPPVIVLQSIDINFSSIEKDQNKFKIHFDKYGTIQSMVLPFNKNNILINIDGISLKNYSSLSYQYWIKGLEKGWSSKFKNSIINLTNLPSGEYIIQIRGEVDGIYSNTLSIKVHILPPFYLNKWFITSFVLLTTLLILLYIKYRTEKINDKNKREKDEIKNRLNKLEHQSLSASMNRHFIFNSLNSIQYYINTQDKYSANKYLSNFAKLMRKNLDASTGDSDVVTLNEELERLRLYLELEKMRFKGRFTYEIDEEDVVTENYSVPPMLLQPFVENSIIHGILPNEDKIGKILITISNYRNHIEIKIHDNGIGILKSKQDKSSRFNTHQSKGVQISSKRLLLLKEFHHLDFELIGPFQTTNEDGLISGTTVLIKIPKENIGTQN